MDWKDVGSYVKKFAPIVGGVIGGPAGGAIGGAVSLLAGAFGITDPEPQPEQVMAAIKADPEAGLKLIKLQNDYKIEWEKLSLQSDQMYLTDRQDARSRQVKTEVATGKKDTNLYALAWLYVGGFFITTILMCALAFTNKVPATMPNYMVFFLGNLFGALTAGSGAIIQYFFGSSKSSNDKTQVMMGKIFKPENK